MSNIPTIVKAEVFPVAGHDCMELNLSGAHAPYFTRNVVILTDSNGVEGVGEIPGGQKITAAIPGRMNGIDTHWIWQEGRERLTKEPMQIVGGCIDLPKKGGLGIEADREQIMKANKLYLDNCLGARNDAIGMQYLIPGWKFDNKKPCLVR